MQTLISPHAHHIPSGAPRLRNGHYKEFKPTRQDRKKGTDFYQLGTESSTDILPEYKKLHHIYRARTHLAGRVTNISTSVMTAVT